LLVFVRLGLAGFHGQHGAQNAVGPVGGQALQAGLPGGQVKVLEVAVGVIPGHIHRLGDGGVDVGGHGGHHVLVGGGGDFQGGDKVVGQLFHVPAQVLVKAPGVVFHRVFLQGAVGHALLPVIGPGEGGLDAVGGIVGEGQGNGAGGGDGEQVGVAQPVLADFRLDFRGQAGGEIAAGEVQLRVKEGEGAPFLG